jgi:hypothetical protein
LCDEGGENDLRVRRAPVRGPPPAAPPAHRVLGTPCGQPPRGLRGGRWTTTVTAELRPLPMATRRRTAVGFPARSGRRRPWLSGSCHAAAGLDTSWTSVSTEAEAVSCGCSETGGVRASSANRAP